MKRYTFMSTVEGYLEECECSDGQFCYWSDAEGELETLRIQLAACGVAAICNTEESTKGQRIGRDNPYWSASYQDVCDAVDREMALRAENEELKKRLAVFDLTPDKAMLIHVANQLEGMIDANGRCPCYEGADGDECICGLQAEYIVVQDWLRRIADIVNPSTSNPTTVADTEERGERLVNEGKYKGATE